MQPKILIIDSVLSWVQSWEAALRESCVVLSAPTLGEAVQLLHQNEDIVLVAASLDLQGGVELLRNWKAGGFDKPMVLIDNQPKYMETLFTHTCKRFEVPDTITTILEGAKV